MKRLLSYAMCLLMLASCGSSPSEPLTTEQKTKYSVLGVVSLGIGAGLYKLFKESKAPTESELIPDIDTTGDIVQLGGVLVNPKQSLHVAHWPIKTNQRVRFDGRGGVTTYRHIITKEDLGYDLAILTFDEPLDTSIHSVMPIGKALPDTPTTAQRFADRPWRGYYVTVTSGNIIRLSTTKDTRFVSGDSGKKLTQIQNDRQVVVGLVSTEKGRSPNLYKLYGAYLEKQNSPK